MGQKLSVKISTSTPKPTTPAPKPTTPTPAPSTNVTYTIKSGDTLSQIARAHNTSVSELKSLNNLKSDLIFVGQKLTLKATNKPVSPSTSKPTPTTPTNTTKNVVYTVKSGDTLSGIASRFNVSVNQLMSWNNLKSAHLIYVNQKLTVKNTSSTSGRVTNKNTTSNTNKTYKVVSGDTLSGIAVRYNTSVSALKSKNNLKSDLIFVGQTLNI